MTEDETGDAEWEITPDPEAQPPVHLIGYARVSMADQNPDLQIDALIAGGVDRQDIYYEQASGGDNKRPELAAMMRALEPGDVVVVWKVDRLSRDTLKLFLLIEQLKVRGCGLVILTMPGMDTRTPAGMLLFGIVAVIAQFERAMILERTAAGLAAGRARGRIGGRKEQYTDASVREVMHLTDREAAMKLKMSLTQYKRRALKLKEQDRDAE